ncbi:hypothetical protein [Maribacter hydrothermalis]|uniref:Phytanoyl-CoA dioxygenase (PhyH) n=1 Tax=Maribacter hydrothermalis TaxID=1836467 RepID=A0A1B7ZDU9_9FLAO|nr:hypothetical protein [Maribacter hydrothermalis]APQ16573.1 hypothetical protein BTR34_04150 [Maribacter hydrothermalis]OBR41522.1 hypothetical protein A9200_12885 [Maribacter hydrothermalis]
MTFLKNGFILVKNVLSEKEIENLITQIDINFELNSKNNVISEGFIRNGVVKNSLISPIIYHPEILKIVKNFLGENIKFLRHNSIIKNFSGGQWHRDSVIKTYENGEHWNHHEPYNIIRVALYLQDSKTSKFKLGFIKKSNLGRIPILEKNSILLKYLTAIEKRISTLNLKNYYFPFFGRCSYVQIEKGDVILFDPRIYHRGTNALGKKNAAIFAYGIENYHFIQHREHYLTQSEYSIFPTALKNELEKRNLLDSITQNS